MASSFWFLVEALIIAFMASPLLSSSSSSSSHLNLATSTISASPAFFSNSPLSPPLPELSPDIAPLLPSPGGVLPSPASSSSVPTITSNPSPPNPDGVVAAGPDSAFGPSGSSLMASSASSLDLVGSLKLPVFLGSVGFWFVWWFSGM